MRFLYSINIGLIGCTIRMASLFLGKAKSWVDGRKDWRKKLANSVKEPIDLWMHCASLGEFDQGLPLLWAFKKKFPNKKILVTFYSPSGFEHFHKRNHCVDYISYLPLDTPKNAKDFIKILQPAMAVFVKYEFWLNYLFRLKRLNIPVYSVSTLLRPNQIFFKWYGQLFRNGLNCFSFFYVQNQETLELLHSIHLKNVMVSGDSRYDTVLSNREFYLNNSENPNPQVSNLSKICKGKKTLILGSSWLEEEEILHSIFSKLSFKRIIIAPHNVSEKHLYELEAMFGDKSIRLSEIENYNQEKIILIDCIGLLNQLYSIGNVAFVGGGFSGSLHNILEPSAYALPVVFGPKFNKFPEAQEFINNGIGFSIQNAEELQLADKEITLNYEEIQRKSIDFMNSKRGATDKIMMHIFQ